MGRVKRGETRMVTNGQSESAASASARHADNTAFKVGANILGSAAAIKVSGMVGQTVIPVPVVGLLARRLAM